MQNIIKNKITAEAVAKTESISISFVSLKMLADDASDLSTGDVMSQSQTHPLAAVLCSRFWPGRAHPQTFLHMQTQMMARS